MLRARLDMKPLFLFSRTLNLISLLMNPECAPLPQEQGKG